jgi:hypothetical protein
VRRALAYGALLAVLVAPVAACDGADRGGSAAPSTSPGAQPAQVLAAAVAGTERQSLRFQLDEVSAPVDGTFDAASGGYTLRGGTGEKAFDLTIFPGVVYMPDPAANDGTFLRIEVARLRERSGLRLLAAPAFALPFLGAATAVEQRSAGVFGGTLDLTKVAASAGHPKSLADRFARAAADRANAVPFTAGVDARGRLSEFTATFPNADEGKDLPWIMRVTEVGGAVTVTAPPAGRVKDLPANGYADV